MSSKNLPNLSKSAKQLQILNDLEREVKDDTLIGLCLLNSIKTNLPFKTIIATIKDQLKENRKAVLKYIPERIINEIEETF